MAGVQRTTGNTIQDKTGGMMQRATSPNSVGHAKDWFYLKDDRTPRKDLNV